MSGEWKQAYDSQMETWRWERSDLGLMWRHRHFVDNAAGLQPSTVDLLRMGYEVEEDKLLHADPFFISREMCEVIAYAAESFEPEPILATDFLTDTGYVYFAEPFKMPDRWSQDTWLGGFSWTPMIAVPKEVDLEAVKQHTDILAEVAGAKQTGINLTLYALGRAEAWPNGWPDPPRRIPIHHTPWWYGMEIAGNERDENDEPTGVETWWKVIQTALRLMQQRIAVRQAEKPDRATRRRGTAKGFHEREVVVVKLRREQGDHIRHEPESDANYSHRFIVNGHWRWQPYPSENVTRQIWISPYVKGDESLPLVIKPKRVFSLVR